MYNYVSIYGVSHTRHTSSYVILIALHTLLSNGFLIDTLHLWIHMPSRLMVSPVACAMAGTTNDTFHVVASNLLNRGRHQVLTQGQWLLLTFHNACTHARMHGQM